MAVNTRAGRARACEGSGAERCAPSAECHRAAANGEYLPYKLLLSYSESARKYILICMRHTMSDVYDLNTRNKTDIIRI